jgi:hypothetical protein
MRDVRPTTCYFTKEELREIGREADAEERASSKIVQFAVRVYLRMKKDDPNRVEELSQPLSN